MQLWTITRGTNSMAKPRILLILLVVALLSCTLLDAKSDKNELFAAVSHLENLVHLEYRLFNATKDYLDSERKKIAGMKKFAESVEKAMEVSIDDPIDYLGNPINAYLILKRFTSGWKELAGRIEVGEHSGAIRDVKTILEVNKEYVPDYDTDYVGALSAIWRIQDTFSITAREISDGKIRGIKEAAHKMTAEECFEIGTLAYSSKRIVTMLDWLQEADRLMSTKGFEDRVGNITFYELFEHLSWAHYLHGHMEKALEITEMALKLKPNDAVLLKNIQIYKEIIKIKKDGRVIHTNDQKEFLKELDGRKAFMASEYAKACRNEFDVKPVYKDVKSLKCYFKRDKPTLILKPAKVERVHDNPEILIFRMALTDYENDKLKELGKPELKRASVYSSGKLETGTEYRISKSAWLFKEGYLGEDLRVIEQIDRKSQDLADLSVARAEVCQVNNYGLGGQYEFHTDYGDPGSPLDHHLDGNRIATLLYYMTDVEAGGETVFTKIGLSQKPRKGDALFWYNLFRNGTGDFRTQHASCPVVSGSKWVMNKWFHNFGNEFIRPCTLNQYE